MAVVLNLVELDDDRYLRLGQCESRLLPGVALEGLGQIGVDVLQRGVSLADVDRHEAVDGRQELASRPPVCNEKPEGVGILAAEEGVRVLTCAESRDHQESYQTGEHREMREETGH